MPLSLSDAEYVAIQTAAAPIHPLQRDAFFKALAKELERHPVIGPGLVHRCAAELQKSFSVVGHRETALALAQKPRPAATPDIYLSKPRSRNSPAA